MKFTAKKSKLINTLEVVERGIPTGSTTISIVRGVLVEVYNGRLYVTSNNLEMSIKAIVEDVEVEKEGAFVLPERFIEAVKRMPEEDISVNVVDHENNLVIELKSGKSRYLFYYQPAEDFPLFTPEEKWLDWDRFDFLAKEFKEILNLVTFVVSKDRRKPAYTGILFKVYESGKLILYASDTFRLARVEKDFCEPLIDLRLVVPGKTLDIISKIIEEDDNEFISCYFSNREIIFVYKNYVIASRLIEDQFADFDQIFDRNFTTSISVKRKSLEESLIRAMLSAEKRLPRAFFDIVGNFINITAEDKIGSYYEKVPISKTGDDIKNYIYNMRFLIEPLRVIKAENIDIEFDGNGGLCKISYKHENYNYKYFLAPIKN